MSGMSLLEVIAAAQSPLWMFEVEIVAWMARALLGNGLVNTP
jgi:hypothetical protein